MNAKFSSYFWVRASESNPKQLSPLMARIILNGKRKDFYSGLFLDYKKWNTGKKKLSGTDEQTLYINKYIVDSSKKLRDIFQALFAQDKPFTLETVKNLFFDRQKIRPTLLEEIDKHIQLFKNRIENEKNGVKITLIGFEVLKNKVEDFIKSNYKQNDIFIDDVNRSFIEKFKVWLLQNGNYYKPTGLATGSVLLYLRKLNTVMLNLFKKGQIKTNPFLDVPLKQKKNNPVHLTMDEVETLENTWLKEENMRKILDRFIVGCYTGMAHSDISNVKRSDVKQSFADEQSWIVISRKKTGELCKIPIFPPIQRIIEKYANDEECIRKNSLFPIVSLQGCNKNLKKIADMANIDKKLTTHAARHTFAQMAMDLGVDIEAIAQILGHADSNTTKSTYVKISHRFVADEVKEFKQKRFGVPNQEKLCAG